MTLAAPRHISQEHTERGCDARGRDTRPTSGALCHEVDVNITWIERDFPGDTYFPDLDLEPWDLKSEEAIEPSGQIPFAYRFSVYERKKSA